MSDYRHCEFRHLMVRRTEPRLGITYYGHVHEDEALHCAYMERLGWPQEERP